MYYNPEVRSWRILGANFPKYLPHGKKQIIMTVGIFAALALILFGVWFGSSLREFGNDDSRLYTESEYGGISGYLICESREALPEGFVPAGTVQDRYNGYLPEIFWAEEDEWLLGREIYVSVENNDIIYVNGGDYAENPWIMFRKSR